MLTRFSIDMDGSMEPDEAGQWVRYEDAVKLREPAQQGPVPLRVAECLAVLRPTVKGKFPQEQALDELVGYLTAPQAQQPAAVQGPAAEILAGVTHPQAKELAFTHYGLSLPVGTKLYTAPQAQQPAPVQEPVAWWKQYPDGSISVVESRTFLADDAVATGWRALGFTDTAPQAQQPAPTADVPMLTDEEVQQLHNSTNAGNALIRIIEQMYRQKVGFA